MNFLTRFCFFIFAVILLSSCQPEDFPSPNNEGLNEVKTYADSGGEGEIIDDGKK